MCVGSLMVNKVVLSKLISKNDEWSATMIDQDPSFFHRWSESQSPEYIFKINY